MNYAVLTDNSTTATSFMNSISAARVQVFNAHTLWVVQNASSANINTIQNASYTYATILLPNPL